MKTKCSIRAWTLPLMACCLYGGALVAQEGAVPQASGSEASASEKKPPTFEEAMPPERPACEDWVGVQKAKKNIPVQRDGESYSESIGYLVTRDEPPEEGYYITFPFSVKTAGSYDLWLACSAIGAGFSSPVYYFLDGEELKTSKTVERGAMSWGISQALSWNKVARAALEAGNHKLKLVVKEKRPMDGQYAIVMDALAVVPRGAGD